MVFLGDFLAIYEYLKILNTAPFLRNYIQIGGSDSHVESIFLLLRICFSSKDLWSSFSDAFKPKLFNAIPSFEVKVKSLWKLCSKPANPCFLRRLFFRLQKAAWSWSYNIYFNVHLNIIDLRLLLRCHRNLIKLSTPISMEMK